MTFSDSINAIDSACSGPKISSVLAVLAPGEVRDFFPEPLWSQVRDLAREFRLVNSLEISEAGFHRELATVDPEVLVACWKTPQLPAVLPPRLKYACHLTGSVKNIVSRGHLDRGLLVTNWGGSISRVVAEGALLHILCCLRRLPAWCLAMHKEGAWKDGDTETASLFGRRVGLHGFGLVARELVKLIRAFGVEINVCAPDVTPAVEREWGVRRVASLDALFAENDVVVELAPLIPETHRIVGEEQLRLLRPGSVFVNVARGAVVDEAALVRVAREGRVQFGLDVFEVEPLPADHPLRGLTNVSLTPHLAGPTNDRRRDAGAWALRNLRAYAGGQPLVALMTADNYDRKT
jgi:phosphoglycerate dehydrogenase-like enzyme